MPRIAAALAELARRFEKPVVLAPAAVAPPLQIEHGQPMTLSVKAARSCPTSAEESLAAAAHVNIALRCSAQCRMASATVSGA